MSAKAKKDRSWGAVVVDIDGGKLRYLLVKHASGDHWDHPKGHGENGEFPEETAVREVREETGLRVSLVPGFFYEVDYELPSGRPKTVGFFLGQRDGESEAVPQEGEILDVAWLEYPDAKERITYDTGKDVLDEAEAFLLSLASGHDKD